MHGYEQTDNREAKYRCILSGDLLPNLHLVEKFHEYISINGYVELLVMLCVSMIEVVDSVDDYERDRHLTILSLDGVHVA